MRKLAAAVLFLYSTAGWSAEPSLVGGTWVLTGVDLAGTDWNGSILVFTSQTLSGVSTYALTGYFSWNGDNGTFFGRENFTGTLFADGSVTLRGTAIIEPASGIVTGTYNARLSQDQNKLIDGTWSGSGGISSNSWQAVRSAAGSCSYDINPRIQSFPRKAGTGSANVASGASCTWTAVSDATWITVVSGASGSGNGTVTYNLAANPGKRPRTGTLTVAGFKLTITQFTLPQSAGTMRGGYWVLDGNGSGLWDGPVVDRNFFWGQPGDIPVTGDWSGSGTTKAGIVRPDGTWVLDYDGNGLFNASVDRVFSFGQRGDVPVVGDWNGSGTMKAGVFRAGQWILDYNGNGIYDGPTFDRVFFWGAPGDTPVVGDWNGSGSGKVGVIRGSQWILDYNGNGTFDGASVDRIFFWGQPGDTFVVGDWNGSGSTKVGIMRPNGVWVLDYNGNGVYDGPTVDKEFLWGNPGDVAVVGDWDGSGTSKAGIIRGGQWILDYNGNTVWDGTLIDRAFYWGQPGDIPEVGRW